MTGPFTIDPRAPFTYASRGSRPCAIIEASDARMPPGEWPRVIQVAESVFTLTTVERDQQGDDIVAVVYTERDGWSLLAVLND
jgi:hypothetical protein